MIPWSDIVCIVFVAATINHLGLIKAIEEVTECRLVIINCPKCLSFWLSFFCQIWTHDFIPTLAVSLLSSYLAVWLELIEGYIDKLYLFLYERIYKNDDNTATTDKRNGDT